MDAGAHARHDTYRDKALTLLKFCLLEGSARGLHGRLSWPARDTATRHNTLSHLVPPDTPTLSLKLPAGVLSPAPQLWVFISWQTWPTGHQADSNDHAPTPTPELGGNCHKPTPSPELQVTCESQPPSWQALSWCQTWPALPTASQSINDISLPYPPEAQSLLAPVTT